MLQTLLQSMFLLSKARAEDVYVGIDLGTTFSCVSVYIPRTKSYEYIADEHNLLETFPSTVYFTGNTKEGMSHKTCYLANAANEENPDSNRYFYGFKRMMGISDITVNEDLKTFPKHVTYDVIAKKDKDGKQYYVFPVKHENKIIAEFTPTELSALILSSLKERIDKKGYKIISTFVSTPAYFSPNQDEQTRIAAEMAGFGKVQTTKEPIAACVNYVKESNLKIDQEKNLLVFDFGGGTLDISVVQVVKEEGETKGSTFSNIEVAKYVGDNFLGGENINDELVKHFNAIIEKGQVKLSTHDMLRLRLFTEKFKIELCNKQLKSDNQAGTFTHSDIFLLNNNKSFEFTLTNVEFDRICRPVYDRIDRLFFSPKMGMFRKAQGDMHDKPMDPDSVEEIILVGGSTRIPYIRRMLKTICKKATLYYDLDADKAVARGACQICVNSDPNSGESSVMVLGAVPLPIGICLYDGSFQPILQKDKAIPTDATMPFTTVVDNQTEIVLKVATGVRPMFKDNEEIGSFVLKLSKGAPKGVPKIEVKVDYYADYTFRVTATDSATGDTNSIFFDSKYGKPDQSKIDAILKAAKENEAADLEIKKKLEQVNLFNIAIQMLEDQTKNSNLSEDDKLYFNAIIQSNKEWLDQYKETATAAVIEAKVEALKKEAEELVKRAKGGEAQAEGEKEEAAAEETAKEQGREVL